MNTVLTDKLNAGFETLTFGKWILTGEHSVLRGHPALVFPLKEKQLKFSFMPHSNVGQQDLTGRSLVLKTSGSNGNEIELVFWAALERATEVFSIDRNTIRGTIEISNSIPLGAGLGASAALCVAISRWLSVLIGKDEKEFVAASARKIENLFHGESSGVDVAVVGYGEPIRFCRNENFDILKNKLITKWKPQLYLSYSGIRGITKECIAKVDEIKKHNSLLASELDKKMAESVFLAEKALQSVDQDKGIAELTLALNQSCEVFNRWGLVNETVRAHLNFLKDCGANAVKPTGSGGGGYCLSLWDHAPKMNTQIELIRCFPAEDV